MANQYLFEIHCYIREKLEMTTARRADAMQRGDSMEVAFYEGQIQEYTTLKRYLAVQFNLSTQTYP